MLLLKSQFILTKCIKNTLYLLSPPILSEDEVTLPRYSVLHYLDTKTNNHFPTRDLYYFKDIPKNKKIPITHISELENKDEISVLENKYVTAEIRKWQQSTLKTFKLFDLLVTPNTDTNLVSVFNYNLLKDLYRYKTSLLSKHFKFYNLYKTYFTYVKKSIDLDTESTHFITIDVPNSIPNYNILDIILKFNTIKFSRIISDEDLLKVIDLYRWLSNDTRSKSTMSDITDEDSKRIIVEFKYKGYSSFLPLYILRGVSKESKLESTIKYNPVKVRKLYIVMLHKLQDKVNSILENNITETTVDDNTLEKESEEIQKEILQDVEKEEIHNDSDILDNVSSNTSSFFKDFKIKDTEELDKLASNIEVENLDKLISSNISKFESDNKEIDKIYEETILKAFIKEDVEETEELPLKVDYSDETTSDLLKNKTIDEAFNKHITEAVEFKTLTSTEIRTLKKLKENRILLKSPYDSNIKLDDFKIISSSETDLTVEDTTIHLNNPLVEDDLKKEIINNFDKKYIQSILKKDIISSVINLEKAGVIIKNYEVEENKSSIGNYEVHKLTLKPLTGKESTVYFRLPKIDSEGEFVSAGIRNKLRKVRTDLPIRKISPIKVALTSNYGKLFVMRTEKKSNDPYRYIVDFIKNDYINSNGQVKKIIPGVKTLNNFKLPNIYHTLASEFNEVRTTSITFLLNYNELSNYIDNKVLEDITKQGYIFCGYLTNKNIVVIDKNNIFYNYSDNMANLGTIESLLNIDIDKVPKPYSVIKILGDNIPLGICLSYYLGLSGLLSVTNTSYKIIDSKNRYSPETNELVIKFSDYKVVLILDTIEKQLIFNGYTFYKDFIKQHNLKEFDYKEIYLNLLEFRDSGLIHIKELNLLEELFLDPITVDVLSGMKEPTDFLRLLLRANELLNDLSHPDINDPNYSRIRGYDRVPGLMYRALSESIRDYKLKGRSNSKIELDPYKVWNYVTRDSTVKITEDTNPILDVKESEIVTLSGLDGLSKDATPKMLRRYHKNDIGLISEATVDSSDVALNTYLSPYAKLKNIRGFIDTDNKEVLDNPAKAFSTSTLLAPMSEYDEPKRINFVSIQNSHSIASDGYMQPILRTGYEYVMPYKAGKLYSIIAEDDGEVIDLTEKIITVKYKNKTTMTYKIGTQYGRMEGGVYPHFLKTTLKKGSKFKANDFIAYNVNFFEPDWLDPSRLIMKFGRTVTVALTMNDEVFEDSSAISKSLSKEMKTSIIKEKIYILDFNKSIMNIVPVGTIVNPNTVLFSVLDNETDFSNLSESSITMLQNLASLAPKAKYNGIIDRYEIKYNGELSDMSPSLKKLASKLDKELYDETKGTEYEATNNKVTSEYRSEGKNLNIDTLELKVYIRIELNQQVGDKGTFANQMKSVVGAVFNSDITTESGTSIDAMFGYKNILNRQVNSTIMIGTTNRLLKHVSKQIADIYFSE